MEVVLHLSHRLGDGSDQDTIGIASGVVHGEASKTSLLDKRSLGSYTPYVNDMDQSKDHKTYQTTGHCHKRPK